MPALLGAAATFGAAALPAPWLPFAPGKADCSISADGATLSNAALRFTIVREGAGLRLGALDNRYTQQMRSLQGSLFTLTPHDAKPIGSSQFRVEGELHCIAVTANSDSARPAEQRAGAVITAVLIESGTGVRAKWSATLRDDTNYVREQLTLEASRDVQIDRIGMIDLELAGAWVDGTVTGSPIVATDRFFGFEHPMAQAQVLGSHAGMWLKRVLPLRAGVATSYSAVLGVTPAGQLRRGFAAYIENERATAFRTFLHYNSWYDIGYFTPYTEAEALAVIGSYGDQLVRRRGVALDSFLFDDGWDDTANLWQFSKDFPRGFAPLRDAAAKIGTAPGMWLSPWGGYGPPRQRRLQTARNAGYEVDEQGLALSGAKYYALFHGVALRLLRDGVNMFKLDGTGSPDKVTPGSAFDSDFAAAIALIEDLRAIRPDLYINLTTGTWPSPFWLRTADSIWRGGEDQSFAGVGSNRQRWITYRDADVYGGIVRQGPLFPLNSLMLHGIIYARKAKGLDGDPANDFADEVHGYFASGTGLQEMYVSPDLLSAGNWDSLAHAARWARERAAILRDSHWIGGDPMRLQVYGYAAWSPQRAIISLRNPSDRAQTYALDVEAALELPVGAAKIFRVQTFYASDAQAAQPNELRADQPVLVTLAPFEQRVWDLRPLLPRKSRVKDLNAHHRDSGHFHAARAARMTAPAQ